MIARRPAGGFTLMELLVALAVIGIITAVGTPMFLSAWRAAKVRAAAEEMAAALNTGRQMAITDNRDICVTYAGNVVRYRAANCDDDLDPPRWTRLATTGVVVTGGQNVRFNYLGAATPAVTYTVTNPQHGQLAVAVLSSGRVRIQQP